MKTIYLVRHSEPIKDNTLPNKDIPLSKNGEELAKNMSEIIFNKNVDELWSSEYKRAIDTAKYISECNNIRINISGDFNERELGNTEGVPKEFWLEQLYDEDVKVEDGESRKEVTERMLNGLNEVLNYSSKTSVIVSHATAITFLLMHYCELKEASLEGKRRYFVFNGKTVINDSFKTPEIFKLSFEEAQIISIERIEL